MPRYISLKTVFILLFLQLLCSFVYSALQTCTLILKFAVIHHHSHDCFDKSQLMSSESVTTVYPTGFPDHQTTHSDGMM